MYLYYSYLNIDLAREYGNEFIIGEIFDELEENIPPREEVFIISKVWPTQLGFYPTSDAIYNSIDHLGTPYVDMYLLHWPSCMHNIDWMHCQDTVDPEGTWLQSWRALEKAYAEGRVQSIGVSNFDADLLAELKSAATTWPHLVQNHGEPGQLDIEVRKWCRESDVIYQPYASLRNIASSRLIKILEELAISKNVHS